MATFAVAQTGAAVPAMPSMTATARPSTPVLKPQATARSERVGWIGCRPTRGILAGIAYPRSQRRRDIQRATLLGNGLIGVVTRRIYSHVRRRARQDARRSGPVVVVDGSAYKE